MNILFDVQSLIAKELKRPMEEMMPEASLVDDLGADSVDRLEICFAVEDFFKIELTDEELSEIDTVRDAADLVKKKLSGDKGMSDVDGRAAGKAKDGGEAASRDEGSSGAGADCKSQQGDG